MTSYKGVKGPFGYDIDENNHGIDLVLPNETVISYSRDSRYTGKYVIERDEMNATMKLISKSPEMLGMLEELSASIHFLNRNNMHATKDKIDNLIKSATEL